MNERDYQWLDLVTYARASGALNFDEATAWARAAVDLGKPATPADLFREIDRIATLWIEKRTK